MTAARTRREDADSVWLLVWLFVAGIAGLLGWRASTALIALVATSVLTMAFGIWVFWRHGGPQITAAGVYCLAQAGFVGFAGLWWAARQGTEVADGIFLGSLLALTSSIGMYGLFWRQTGADFPVMPFASRELSRWMCGLGLAMTVVSAIITTLNLGLALVTDVAIYVGVTLFAAGMLIKEGRTRLDFWALAGLAASFSTYYRLTFNGFGRLTLVSLALGLALLACTRLPNRRFKALTLIGAPLGVAYLAQTRVNLAAQLNGDVDANAGLGSVVSPLQTFGRLIDAPGWEFGHGETFWATMTVFVPRSLWPDKPLGFGAELTRILEPQLAKANHTMAGLDLSEWWFNFGFGGIVLMVLVVGFAVRCVDAALRRLWSSPLRSRGSGLRIAALSLTIGGLADFVWVGLFTYMTRGGLRLIAVAVLAVVFVWLLGRRNQVQTVSGQPSWLALHKSSNRSHLSRKSAL